MRKWRDFPLPDGSYSDDTRPWSQQDVYNYLPTRAEQSGTRSPMKYLPVPGLDHFANVGTGPHRGGHDVEGRIFVVSGNKLYQVATDGTATERGTIPGTGRVSMTHNQIDGGNELLIGTGSNSYVWNTVTEALTANGVPLFSVDFLNQLCLGVDQQRRFWRYSGLADATSWNTLDNESAESSPDRIIGGIVSQGQWLVFGERTIEAWDNTPTQDTAFQRTVVIERGCANWATLCRLDNSVMFVGNDSIPYRLSGYTATPIAPKAITEEIARHDPKKLFAFTYEDNGYVIYYVTAQDGYTWGFDVTGMDSGNKPLRHRRESFGLTRWRINTLFKSNGAWYAGDYANGKLYRLKWKHVYEGCEIMPRGFRSGVLHNGGNRMRVHGMKLLVNTGMPSSTDPKAATPTISGAIPAAVFGDSVDYQYTISPAYPGQPITLTLEGELPTGLTISSSGRVTGTISGDGSYTWTITPSSDCSTGAALNDSMVVSEPEIFMWRIQPNVATYVEPSICIDGDIIAVAHDNNRVSYSLDRGYTWTILSGVHPSAPSWKGVIKYEGDWYLFGLTSGGIAMKADGDSFSFYSISIPFKPPNTDVPCAFLADGYIYISQSTTTSANYFIHRFDGTTYTPIDTGIASRDSGSGICGITKAGAYWLLYTEDGTTMRTSDFSSFTSVFTTSANSKRVNGIGYLNGKVLMGTQDGKIYTSTDYGATFDAGVSASSTNGLERVISNGYHFISGGATTVYTSPDGTPGSWTLRLDSLDESIYSIGVSSSTLSAFGTFGSTIFVGDVS